MQMKIEEEIMVKGEPMSNEFTLTLNSPITEAQWVAIDVDFEHMNEITFHTKHGKEVKFVKASAQPEDYAHGFVDGYKQGKKDAQPERNTCDYWDNESGYCALSRPSAQPEPQWIPWNSGRFPEESGTYTVTAYDGATKRVTYAKYQKRLKRWELTGAGAYWRVLAWMPLPESYKEESDGND